MEATWMQQAGTSRRTCPRYLHSCPSRLAHERRGLGVCPLLGLSLRAGRRRERHEARHLHTAKRLGMLALIGGGGRLLGHRGQGGGGGLRHRGLGRVLQRLLRQLRLVPGLGHGEQARGLSGAASEEPPSRDEQRDGQQEQQAQHDYLQRRGALTSVFRWGKSCGSPEHGGSGCGRCGRARRCCGPGCSGDRAELFASFLLWYPRARCASLVLTANLNVEEPRRHASDAAEAVNWPICPSVPHAINDAATGHLEHYSLTTEGDGERRAPEAVCLQLKGGTRAIHREHR
mmetsp:Transcript_6681/g.20674  ORF Transcript_6681/g.20674 Transcript_6681/m.20674 type:complete len:288 (+) Transcript_6681:207-1070(+)